MKYVAIFKIQLANRLAYLGDLIAGSLSILIFLWVFIQLWSATYRTMGQESIGGLTLANTLWYLMMTESIQLSKPRLSKEVSDAVKDGSIAYLLNKPYNFLLYQLSVALADGASRFGFNLLMGGALLVLLVSAPPSPLGWPLVLVAVLFGWVLDFCVQALIGLAAFVMEDVSAFDWIYQKLIFILGGMLIPLDFFPDWLRNLSLALPFAYTMYGPARLFVEPDLGRFATLLAGQLLWVAILGGFLALAYRRGLKWLTVNGG
ncbi:MAG: ABC transporter permease [Chloroflexota bacterium]